MRLIIPLLVASAIWAPMAAHARSVAGDKNRSEIFTEMCRGAVALTQGDTSKLPNGDKLVSFVMDTADCYGYIRGFIDGHNMTADHAGNTKQFCVPGGVSNVQLARVVVQASDDRPDIGHTPRETLVEYALKLNWPCAAE